MRLSSQSSQFIFNLPSDFLPNSIIKDYTPILEKNFIQYENVIDYINSTIQEVAFPGLSIETAIQKIKRGKEINYKPATNIHDILSSREIDITFRSVDSNLNYFLLWDIYVKHYLDTDNLFVKPFTLTAVDIHRDAIYQVKFMEIILKSLSEYRFKYNSQLFNADTFTLTLSYNFIDIEFLLTDSKVLDTGGPLPTIINKIK